MAACGAARRSGGLLFVPETLRSQNLGTRLLETAESEAKARGCVGAWLDTLSTRASRFYQRRGYRICGQIEDLPRGNTRFFFSKRL